MKKVRILITACCLLGIFLAAIAFSQMKDMRSATAKKAVETLATERAALMKKGEYSCCLKHPCAQCMMSMGMCPCGMNAANDKPVCQECKGSWDAGDGRIPGKKASDIEVMPRGKM
ncbi:MAG TPA: hypothetical protein VNI20_06460 [Fimbriimonadaceae bacterium]|nr:hypothetical protein [Fimbriimonadaceae bacterium]